MENQFLVDSEYLSPEALAVKHRLEILLPEKIIWNIYRAWRSLSQTSVVR